MANYNSQYSGSQIDEAVGKALAQTPITPTAKTSAMTQEVGIDSDGKLYTAPGGGGGSVTDVKVNGTTVVSDGVANIPLASATVAGAVKPVAKTSAMTSDVGVGSDGKLYSSPADPQTIGTAVNAYLDEHPVQPTPIVDNLESTDSNKALSAKQGNVIGETIYGRAGGISGYAISWYLTAGTAATWQPSTEANSGYLIPLKSNDTLSVSIAATKQKFRYCYLKSDTIAQGSTPDYADMPVQRTLDTRSISETAPSNTNWLYVSHMLSSSDTTPDSVVINGVNLMETVVGLEDKVETNTEEIDSINNKLTTRPALADAYFHSGVSLSSTGTWGAYSAQSCWVIDITGKTSISVTANSLAKGNIAIINDAKNVTPQQTVTFATGYSGYISISINGTKTLSGDQIPSDAHWMFVSNVRSSDEHPISIVIDGIEYLDERLGIIDDVDKLKNEKESTKTSIDDVTSVMFMGSSLTDSYYKPQSSSWIERLNDLTDVCIINNGKSGKNLLYNIEQLCTNIEIVSDTSNTPRKVKPKYIAFGNTANGTGRGATGRLQLMNAKEVADSYGAVMLVSSEEDYAGMANDYGETFTSFADEFGLDYSFITKTWRKCYPSDRPFKGDLGKNHGGYRLMAPYMEHLDMLNAIPIKKNVKMFKVRPTYKNGSPAYTDLVYDTNEQRLKFFTAISSGAHAGTTSGHMDNLDQESSTAYDVPATDPTTSVECEVSKMLRKSAIQFDKFALIEFILEKTQITKGDFSIDSTKSPTAVYVAKCNNVATTAQEVRTTFEEVDFTYEKSSINVHLESNLYDIQLYDKVRILIEYSSSFSLANPVFKNYDGFDKLAVKQAHSHRKFGTELFSTTSMQTGWSVSGTAEVAAFPSQIANYTSYNNVAQHLQLNAEGDSASRSITIPEGTKRLAVRIVGQMFTKYASTRWSGTEIASSEYIATTSQYIPYDYDYGTIRVKVGGTDGYACRDLIMYQGWGESYFEVYVPEGVTSMTISIAKKSFVDSSYSNGDKPILIHNVSVQAIG